MSNQKELTSDLEAITSIRTITSIYQEISSFRMNQLRGQVAKTREFLDGVAAVYNHTKTAYLASLQNVPFDNRKKKMIGIVSEILQHGVTVWYVESFLGKSIATKRSSRIPD